MVKNIPFYFLVLLVLLVPLVPDERILRYKLLVLEGLLAAILLTGGILVAVEGRMKWGISMTIVASGLYGLYVVLQFSLAKESPVAAMELRRAVSCLAALGAGFLFGPADSKQRKFLLQAWVLGLALASCYGVLQRYGGLSMFQVPRMERVFSTFGNPIFLGAYLVVSLPLVWGWYFQQASRGKLVMAACVTTLTMAALWFSQTRASVLAFLASLFVFYGAMEKTQAWLWTKKLWQVKMSVSIVIALLVSVHLIAWAASPFYQNSLQKAKSSVQALAARHQAHRLIWQDTFHMWQDHKLLGVGLGSFHLHFPEYASDQLKMIWPSRNFIVNYAHNEYLQTLCETGILGLLLYLLIFGSFFWQGFQQLSSAPPFMASGLAGTAAVLAQNFFSVDMRFTISAALVFLLMGLTLSQGSSRTISLPGFARGALGLATAIAAIPLGAVILKPYRAGAAVAAQPDFFEPANKELTQTIAQFQAQAKSHPQDARAYEELAYRYSKQKDWANAVAHYQKALSLNPGLFGAYNNLGNISFMTGQRAQAIGYYQQSLKINPQQVDARLNLGKLYYTEGRLREATEQFQAVLQISPNNQEAIVMLKRLVE